MNEQEYFPEEYDLVPRELAVKIMKDISDCGGLTSTTIKLMEEYQKDRTPRNTVIDRLLQINDSSDTEMVLKSRDGDEDETPIGSSEEAQGEMVEDSPEDDAPSGGMVFKFVGKDVAISGPSLAEQWASLKHGDVFLDKEGDVCVMTEPINGESQFMVLRTAGGVCGGGQMYTFTYFSGIDTNIVYADEPFSLTIETQD